jgi:hypothetical protein
MSATLRGRTETRIEHHRSRHAQRSWRGRWSQQHRRRAGGAVELTGMTKDIRKLSDAQLYALDLVSRYKL